MGIRKALAWEREQESAQAQQFPLTELLAMKIEHNRESWLERANINLEAKLEKGNKELNLQRRLTKHYKWRNHFARKKLKIAQNEGPAPKYGKDQARLGILAQASLQVSRDLWGTYLPNLREIEQLFVFYKIWG